MCVGLSTNNWNGLWVSALWAEVPATGADQWELLARLRLSVCSLCVPPGLLGIPAQPLACLDLGTWSCSSLAPLKHHEIW